EGELGGFDGRVHPPERQGRSIRLHHAAHHHLLDGRHSAFPLRGAGARGGAGLVPADPRTLTRVPRRGRSPHPRRGLGGRARRGGRSPADLGDGVVVVAWRVDGGALVLEGRRVVLAVDGRFRVVGGAQVEAREHMGGVRVVVRLLV